MPDFDISKIRADSSDWELFEVTPTMRRYRLWLDENQYIIKTEYIEDEALIEQNKQLYNDSDGKRFGDGKVVARVPLNMLYSEQTELARRMKEGDPEHLKWWLNRDEARPYRTFKGRI